jgi:deoxyhypusine synthase
MALPQSKFLREKVEHIDVTAFNAVPLIEAYEKMAFQARNLARGSKIFNQMVSEKDCTIILCLAGSLISAGLKKTLTTLIQNNMVDCIVSTGANMVDMDFFEGLGFRHYIGDPRADDHVLQEHSIDRIYDTYISEHDLRVCDASVAIVADQLEPRPHTSREFMAALGEYLVDQNVGKDSVLRICYEKNIPVFVPALSDCSAGFGLAFHQKSNPDAHVTHDSVRDFSELTTLVAGAKKTGVLIVGGGVPKNFTADTVVCADILGLPAKMHKYAVQITVADERDGALSGSTLREAHSWGKVEQGAEQMIFSEATLALPLLASYAYHKGDWKKRNEKKLNATFARRVPKHSTTGTTLKIEKVKTKKASKVA